MNYAQALELRSGDMVHWTDPDNGECSRTLKIKNVTVHGDLIMIVDEEGGYLECYPDELTLERENG